GVANMLALAPPEQEPSTELRERIMGVVDAEATPRVAESPRESWLDRIRGSFGAQTVALGAAAVLLIGLLSWNVLLQQETQDLQGQVQGLQTQDEPPGVNRTIALQGTEAASDARAEVLVLDDDRRIMVAENMPSVPEDQTFQIWVFEGDEPLPSGLMAPEKATSGSVTTSLEGADAIAVTAEPAGGSPAPTSDPLLLKTL
ncbi:MAG: anti-sigma factor, partial [Rubrobacter sp.]